MVTENSSEVFVLRQNRHKDGCCSPYNVDSDLSFTGLSSRTHPGWRPKSYALRRIRLHANATTPFGATKQWHVLEDGHVEQVGRDGGCSPNKTHCSYRISGDVFRLSNIASHGPVVPSTLDTTSADNRARSEALSAIRQARGTLQSLVVAGEIGKTLSMIARPGQALRSALNRWNSEARRRVLNEIRRKNWRRLKPKKRRVALEKAVTGTYLEWVFGVTPLIHDLDDAASVIAKEITQSREWAEPFRGVGYSDSITYTAWNVSSSFGPLRTYHNVRRHADVKVKYQGKLVIAPSKRVRMQRLGLTLQQFTPSLWELLPYSWLVDYFLNVGEVLDGWGTCVDDVRWVQRTIVQDSWTEACDQRATGTYNITYNPVISFSFSPGRREWHSHAVNRSVYGGSLRPRLHFRIPGSGRQWTNISAVVLQGKAVQALIARALR